MKAIRKQLKLKSGGNEFPPSVKRSNSYGFAPMEIMNYSSTDVDDSTTQPDDYDESKNLIFKFS